MRARVHFGLAALLILAPAFCCCNIRGLAAFASAAPAPACPSCPESAPPPVAGPAGDPCCREAEPEAPAPEPSQHPAKPVPPDCQCLGERPDATAPEAAPAVAAPEPTGELLPAEFAGSAGLAPEHLGLLGGLDPPGWAGVDARSEALFSRHVLRC